MSSGLKDTGEEYVTKSVFRTDQLTRPSTVDVLLFNDNTDALADGDDIGSITTEPSGSAYARQSVSLDTTDMVSQDNGNANWEIDIVDQVFDTSDSSTSVDSYAVTVTFDADDTSDGGTATTHLFWVGSLDQSYDLSNIDTFTLQNSGLIFD